MPEFNFGETIARNGFVLVHAIIHLVKCVRQTKPRGEIRHCLHVLLGPLGHQLLRSKW